MKYLISNIEFKKATNGTPYMRLTLMNEDDIFDGGTSTIIFQERIVNAYRKALNIDANALGTVDANKLEALPAAYKYMTHMVFVEQQLPKPMCRIYNADFTDGKGVLHKAGTLVCDRNGNPKLYTSFRILCKEVIDNETGERSYANGWDPVTVGNNYISSFFVSPDTTNTVVPTPPTPVEPAPVQPTPQPAPVVDNPLL